MHSVDCPSSIRHQQFWRACTGSRAGYWIQVIATLHLHARRPSRRSATLLRLGQLFTGGDRRNVPHPWSIPSAFRPAFAAPNCACASANSRTPGVISSFASATLGYAVLMLSGSRMRSLLLLPSTHLRLTGCSLVALLIRSSLCVAGGRSGPRHSSGGQAISQRCRARHRTTRGPRHRADRP